MTCGSATGAARTATRPSRDTRATNRVPNPPHEKQPTMSASHDDSDARPIYPITQAELESYRQLETVVRRYGKDLADKRASIMARMGGP